MTSEEHDTIGLLNMNNRNGWIFAILVTILLLLLSSSARAQNLAWYQAPDPFTSWSEYSRQKNILKVASGELGVRERSGNNDGFDVEKYLATTGLNGGYAWCAAFINWVYEQVSVATPTNKKAWSPSWFPPDRTYWQLGSSEFIQPEPGDVFGIYFKSRQRIAHVGIIEHWHGNYAMTIEGNTNQAGSREGDGVYRKRRLKRQVSKVSKWTNG